MARDPTEKVRVAAEAVLVDGETVTSKGVCWAAQRRGRVPLPLLARRQYLLALTDRRILVFERGRRPAPSDLVLGKRYETFTLERVRRGFPLLQVRVRSANGNRMVFEFRPGNRELGGELVARLTPRTPDSGAPGATEAATENVPAPETRVAAASDAPRPLGASTNHDETPASTPASTAATTPATSAESANPTSDTDGDGDGDEGSDARSDSGSRPDAARDPVAPWVPWAPSTTDE